MTDLAQAAARAVTSSCLGSQGSASIPLGPEHDILLTEFERLSHFEVGPDAAFTFTALLGGSICRQAKKMEGVGQQHGQTVNLNDRSIATAPPLNWATKHQ